MKKFIKKSLAFISISLSLLFISSVVLAADSGFQPANDYTNNNGVTNPIYALTDLGYSATFDNSSDSIRYTFGTSFSSIPSDAAITGIEVRLHGFTNGRQLRITLVDGNTSRNNKTTSLTSTNAYHILGSSTDDWYTAGSWTVSDFTSNNNFKVLIEGLSGGGTASLDYLEVKVHYSTSPSVTTNETATAVSNNSATTSGNVTSDGGSTVTARGIEVSTSSSFTSYTEYPASAGGTGTFSVDLSSLTPNTTYYYRAYAVNSRGTSRGSIYNFTTRTTPLITDYEDIYDGIYHNVTVENTAVGDTVYYSLDNINWETSLETLIDVTSETTVYVKITNPNYSDFLGSGSVTITPRELTISGAIAQNKKYDKNTTATVDFSSAILNNLVSGDAVALNFNSYIALFSDAEVENDKLVTVTGLIIEGIKASNYTLQAPLLLEGDILVNNDKQYSSTASVLPKTGANILLITAGTLVATGLSFIALNKKFRSK